MENGRLVVPAQWIDRLRGRISRRSSSKIIKELFDSFLTPEQYGVKGGTSVLRDSAIAGPVVEAIERKYCAHLV